MCSLNLKIMCIHCKRDLLDRVAALSKREGTIDQIKREREKERWSRMESGMVQRRTG
jgi:hypothetical protein